VSDGGPALGDGPTADRASTIGHRASPIGHQRVALVHDWLTGMRGGEKVLEAISELYPGATLHTLLHVHGSVSPALERLPERTSFVQWLPSADRHYRRYLPLFPTAVELFDFDGYDLVISTSHCSAKSVVVPGRIPHVCYCHSPMRYAWDQFDSYFGPAEVGAIGSRVLRRVMARLARWDRATAGRVDRYVANSHYVAGRIRRYYNRGSTVVYPPVDTEFYRPDPARRPESFFLVVSALVPYKRLDVAIRACAEARAPLTIVGKGPEERRLQERARSMGAQVTFAGWLDDSQVRELYQRSRAVLMTGAEDFGMVPVEAQACGRPVVALAEGGALESVVDGHTGLLVRENSAEAFAAALREVSSREFDASAIRRHAETFSKARFQQQFRRIVDEVVGGQPSRQISDEGTSDADDRSNAARYAQPPPTPATREDKPREDQRSNDDPRQISDQATSDADDRSNAARYAQRPPKSAVREDKPREDQRSNDDPRQISDEGTSDADDRSNAARYAQPPPKPAAREDKPREDQRSNDDHRQSSDEGTTDPDDRSHAARYAQRPPKPAAREDKP
jgi:glycosyltransferase involved in cell wall biosynthesis